MHTHMSEDLKYADVKARYNAYCKKLLSNRQVVVRIVKGAVEEFADSTLEEIEACLVGEPEVEFVPVLPGEAVSRKKSEYIRNEQNVDDVPGEGEFTYDVRFRIQVPGKEERAVLYINLEGQKEYSLKYPLTKRGIFYGARMISGQYGIEFNGKDYSGIKKVYSIWICMNVPKYTENSIIVYRIVQQVLSGRPKKLEARENYDLLTVVQILLGKEEQAEDALVRMLQILFSERMDVTHKKKILEERYGMEMQTESGKEIGDMLDFADLIEERGIERGMAQGIERGMAQGIERGVSTGEHYFAVLARKLLAAGRTEDLMKATENKVLREALYKEYGIKK